MAGKLTKLAPIPKPAPERALTAKLGKYVSKILNVAAAVKAINKVSSILNFLEGITKAANATITPSTKYLRALFTNSPTSNANDIL